MEDHLSILCNQYLLWAYYVPDVVEDQSFIHFPPKNIYWASIIQLGEMEIQPLVIHKFFLLNAYYVLERWKIGYCIHFSKKILLHTYWEPEEISICHLFVHLVNIYLLSTYYMLMVDEDWSLIL